MCAYSIASRLEWGHVGTQYKWGPGTGLTQNVTGKTYLATGRVSTLDPWPVALPEPAKRKHSRNSARLKEEEEARSFLFLSCFLFDSCSHCWQHFFTSSVKIPPSWIYFWFFQHWQNQPCHTLPRDSRTNQAAPCPQKSELQLLEVTSFLQASKF